jgi:hypothetical protein
MPNGESDNCIHMVWRWTPDGIYTAHSAYRMLHTGATSFRGHRLVWKTWAPLRVRIFLWLALRRRHWTADRRARHGLEARDTCFLCDQAQDTIDHIIAACPFTRELWHHILQALGLQLPEGTASTLTWWRRLRALASGQRWKGLDSLFALVSWQVWKERNARCFRDASSTVVELLQLIKLEADWWIEAGAAGLADLARG